MYQVKRIFYIQACLVMLYLLAHLPGDLLEGQRHPGWNPVVPVPVLLLASLRVSAVRVHVSGPFLLE